MMGPEAEGDIICNRVERVIRQGEPVQVEREQPWPDKAKRALQINIRITNWRDWGAHPKQAAAELSPSLHLGPDHKAICETFLIVV